MKNPTGSSNASDKWYRIVSASIFLVLPLLSHQVTATELSSWNSLLNFDLLVADEMSDAVKQLDTNQDVFLPGFTPVRSPRGIAVGPDGNVYVSSVLDGRIVAFDGDGAFQDEWFLPSGWRPSGLTFGHDGKLYIASLNTSSSSGLVGGVFALDIGEGTLTSFVAAGSGGLADPWGIVLGPDKKYYVASRKSDQVLRYKSTGAFDRVFVNKGGPASLLGPRGLAFGPDGHLYVSSSSNDRVLRFNGKTGAFLDEFASASDPDVLTGLIFGANGDLYVSSGGATNAILQYDGETGDLVDQFGGLSAPAFMAHKAPYVYGCILVQGSPPVAWTAEANKGLEASVIDSKGCYAIPVVQDGWNLSITLK